MPWENADAVIYVILATCRGWMERTDSRPWARSTISLNTSFNENELVVCTPEETLDCFHPNEDGRAGEVCH